MSFEAESNSELTVIVPAYQMHFRFPVQNKIHKQNLLSDTRTGILGSIAGPCDFLPARSDEFQKVWKRLWYFFLVPSLKQIRRIYRFFNKNKPSINFEKKIPFEFYYAKTFKIQYIHFCNFLLKTTSRK